MEPLTYEDFEEYPVWKWNDSQDDRKPVLDWNPLPEGEPTLFIKARFIAVDGTVLDGYLVGLDSFYAVGVFVGGRTYVMNLNLPDLLEQTLVDVCGALDRDFMDLFPLKYETEVSFKDEENLQGLIERS